MRITSSIPLSLTLFLLGACSDGGSSGRVPPAGDTPPSVSSIADTTVPANSGELSLSFTVTDSESAAQALTVTAEADNSSLLAGQGPVLSGSAEDRAVLLTPEPGAVGMATITVTVTDGAGQGTSTSFVLTVVPQQLAFSTAVRSAFAADENDEPQTLNDKEFGDDVSTYDDLVRN